MVNEYHALKLYAKVDISRIATLGCEIHIIHPSRVLDPALQMSKMENQGKFINTRQRQGIIRN